jgi:hypothetical protein
MDFLGSAQSSSSIKVRWHSEQQMLCVWLASDDGRLGREEEVSVN